MTKEALDKFIAEHTFQELQDNYNTLNEKQFKEFYNLSFDNIRTLRKIYGLHVLKETKINREKQTWADKSTSIINKHNKLLLDIPKDLFIDLYITKNYSIEKLKNELHISLNDILFLISQYNCKKPKTLSSEITKQTKFDKYSNSNYNNPEKRAKTCIEKYGVNNTFKSENLMQYAYNLKEKRYGIGNANNWIKNHQTRILNYGSLEESYKQQSETCKNTCLEKYGVECYLLTSDARSSQKTKDSKPNLMFKNLLESNDIFIDDNENREFKLNNRAYDFKINNILIEINPFVTHNSTWSPFGNPLDKNYHYEKSKLARDNNYRCIHIWDWDDPIKIIQLLKNRQKIYARKCAISIVNLKDAKIFIEENHLQGYTKSEINIGLYYENELVSIMTFGKPRYNKKYDYELIRYCSSKNIIGGAEKLFSYFIKNYNPKSIISYCDLSKFNGNTYEKLGFELKCISIGKHWYNPKTGQHITDNLLRQRGFDQLFNTNYGKGTSNEELMLNAGFVEIYDAGQATYIKNIL